MANGFLVTFGLALLSLSTSIAQPQGFKIYYNMTFQKDSADTTLQSEMMELLVNGEQSLFRSVTRAARDTNEFYPDLKGQSYSYAHTETNYRILKDHAQEETKCYEKVEIVKGAIRTYSEPRSDLAWQVAEDTLTVSGHFCQKAMLSFGNRVWEAWFTPDIPIYDGPYKFWGLPGLIVSVKDATESWKFNLIGIEPLSRLAFDLAFLNDAEVVEKGAFYEYKRYYVDNRAQIVAAQGNVEYPTEEIRHSITRTAGKWQPKTTTG